MTIRHCKRVVLKLDVVFLPEKYFVSERGISQERVQKASTSICTLPAAAFAEILYPTHSTFQLTPENTEEDVVDL